MDLQIRWYIHSKEYRFPSHKNNIWICYSFIGFEMYFRESKAKVVKEFKIVLVMIGLISGMLCGLYGIGALLAAYVIVLMGIISVDIFKDAIILIPFMLIGLFVGMKSSAVLNEKIVKKVVILMLILSGIGLIVNNL